MSPHITVQMHQRGIKIQIWGRGGSYLASQKLLSRDPSFFIPDI